MIKSIRIAQILDNPVMVFTRSKDQLSTAEKEAISKKRAYHYKFEEDVYSFEQRLFFSILMKLFIERFELYFCYLDKIAEPPTKLRSHKKLMHAHKKSIGPGNLYEEEVELDAGKTIMYSIIHLDEANVDYVCKHLVDSRFVFGVVRDKQEGGDLFRGLALTELIQTNPPSSSNIFDLNLLRAVNQLVNNTSSVISISRDGLNNDYLSLFYENESHLELMKGMKGQFKVREVDLYTEHQLKIKDDKITNS